MSETATPVAAAKSTEPKSITSTYVDGKGNILRFLGVATKTGFNTFSEHVVVGADGKAKSGKRERGASEAHATFASAEKWVTKAEAAAEKAGWKRKAGPGGFVRQPDAFTLANLPAPKK